MWAGCGTFAGKSVATRPRALGGWAVNIALAMQSRAFAGEEPTWRCAKIAIPLLVSATSTAFVRIDQPDMRENEWLFQGIHDDHNEVPVNKPSPFSIAWLGRLLAAAAIIGLAGCSSAPLESAPAKLPAGEDYTYIIGPGDGLHVLVWRNPELSMTVTVRPDGKLSAPLVEDLVAQGKTPEKLAREVETILGKYVRDPVVTVMVTGVVGQYSEQIRVVGEAARPQFLPFKNKMTLLDVMIAVGGLTDFASGNKASILRTAEGNKQYAVRLQDLMKRGDVSANVEMRPGDILIIPQSWF